MTTISISKLFDNRFLKSDDIGDTNLVCTIDRVELEVLGYGESRDEKAVVYFKEIDKVLVLNKTNATSISRMYGDDTAEWKNKKIALYTKEVDYRGETFLGIRVRFGLPVNVAGSSQSEA